MNLLLCPICASELVANEQGVSCHNRHQFDRAREGYFNLLPVQFKHSREPGDAKQQLDARRTFLQAGFFQPLVHRLVEHIPATTGSLLDIGCGEGYFTRAMSEHIYDAQIYGIDIAKAAVKLAAKSSGKSLAGTLTKNTLTVSKITYAVASSYVLPVVNSSMDVITRIYAPSKDEELVRVLKPNGKLIIITPGENHLLGLRKKIYQQIRPHPHPTPPSGFVEVQRKKITFDLQVSKGEQSMALLQMTPFAWRMQNELFIELTQSGLVDQADFQLTIYQKQ